MKKSKQNTWVATDITGATNLGDLEFQDCRGEFHHFVVLATPEEKGNSKLVFGGVCNAGFLESGHIHRADCESQSETLSELLSELETFYNDGPEYCNRICFNERM